jgi:predicted small lipoprotein YifL
MKTMATVALVAALAACNARKGSLDNTPAAAVETSPVRAADMATKQEAPATGGSLAIDAKKPEDARKVIRTGHVDLVVTSYDDARAKLEALVKAAGGYVDATNVTRRTDQISDAQITIRLPKDAFGSMLPKLREIGEVVSESTNASDITDQYVDISARLASARTLEKRLLELASEKTGNIDQVLSVERELARVRGEIEGYEGHLRQWNDQIEMSTLSLSLQTKRPEIAAAPAHQATLGERTSGAWADSISALRELGSSIVIGSIAILPWLVLAIPGAVFGRKLWRRRRRLPAARVA